MKKTAIYCIALSIIALAACSSPKKVGTESDSTTQESTQKSQNNNTNKMTQVLLKTKINSPFFIQKTNMKRHILMRKIQALINKSYQKLQENMLNLNIQKVIMRIR